MKYSFINSFFPKLLAIIVALWARGFSANLKSWVRIPLEGFKIFTVTKKLKTYSVYIY